MPGATRKPYYRTGEYRLWYNDHRGKRVWAKGTNTRKETLEWAFDKQKLENKLALDLAKSPGVVERHSHQPIAEVISEYLEYGMSTGGRRGGPWGPDHAKKKQAHLGWWTQRLDLAVLGDLVGILPKVEAGQRELLQECTGKTVNNYTEALRSFCHWCVEREYLDENPLRRLKKVNGSAQSKRRALTEQEVQRLLSVSPPHRSILYETAIKTGLRANELRNLTLKHLDLAQGRINLDAAWTKGRRDESVHVPMALLVKLRAFGMSGEARRHYALHRTAPQNHPTEPLLFVPTGPARDLEVDLKAAGIKKHTDEGKVDFHSFRNTCATLMLEAGATPKETQDHMRHTTIDLTMITYARSRHEGLSRAVEAVDQMLQEPETCAEGVLAAVVGGEGGNNKPQQNVGVISIKEWCRRGDSNPHAR